VFANCRSALYSAGGPLLERAQEAKLVRADVDIADVLHLISGVAKISATSREQADRLLDVALDGLRYVPPAE
jgi:hypothetical protein